MKNPFRSVVQWFRPAPRVEPEQLQEALRQMLADPENKRLLLNSLFGTVLPLQGGNPGTQNYLAKFDQNGSATLDSGAYGDNSGNIGIGTTSPGYKLHVAGGSLNDIRVEATSFAKISLNRSSGAADEKKWQFYADASVLYFTALNDAENAQTLWMQVIRGAGTAISSVSLPSGNVGIGTTGPGEKLDVTGNTNVTGYAHVGSFSPISYPNAQGAYIGWNRSQGVGEVNFINHIGAGYGGFFFEKTSNGSTFTRLLTIDASGNVGIGTPAPARKLHVVGGATDDYQQRLEAASGRAVTLEFYEGTTNRGKISTGATALSIYNGSAQVSAAIHLRQDSGYVGIGTAAPGEKLDVAGKILSQGLNQIVFLKPSGSNDGTRINEEISKPALANGGIIYLMPGDWSINTSVLINRSGVKLRGYGGAQPGLLSGSPLTRLLWAGGASTEAIISVGSSSAVQDVEISDLEMDGNGGNAGIGLLLDNVTYSRFKNLAIYKVNTTGGTDGKNGVGLKLFVTTPSTMSWNVFERISVLNAWKGVVLDSNRHRDPQHPENNSANPAHNTFTNMNLWFCYEYGIELGDCDNNSFRDITGPGALGDFEGAKACVLLDLEVPVAGGQTWARSNYFYHLQAAGKKGLVGIVGPDPQAYKDAKNVVFGYDYANDEKQPRAFKAPNFLNEVFNVTNYFFWTDSYGASSDTEFRNWSNGKRAAIGLAMPGDVPGDNLAFSTFDGTAWSRRVTVLNASGNVGIGDPNPGEKLTVNGNVSAAGIKISGSAPDGQYLRGNGSAFVASAIQAADIPDASATASGKVTTSAQTFAGLKTFQDGVNIGGGPVQVGGGSAKGDIVTNQSPSAVYRLTVGSDGSALVADSTQTGGIKWLAGMLNCQNGNKKVKFGVGTFSGGTTTVNTGLTSVDFFFAQLLNAGQTGDSISINYPSGGSVDCYLTSNGSNQFYWFAVGS